MSKQQLVRRIALALAGGLLAAACAGSGVMPISGGGVIDTIDQAPVVAQPQMNTSLEAGAPLQAHSMAVAHMQSHSTAAAAVDTFYDMYHHGLCDNMD